MGQPATHLQTVQIDGQTITYQERDGYGVIQGDILIGLASQLASPRFATGAGLIDETSVSRKSAGQIFSFIFPAHWPNATMYYTIDPDVPNPSRILTAIDHWNTRTPFAIMPRATQPNYVRFQRTSSGNACSSYVGMQGGAQAILLEDACTSGNTIHEIGHAWGLLHEQSRNDRNANVTVLFENVDKRFASNYDQDLRTTQDQSYYDFDSIMHYGFRDFSSNGSDTLESVPLGIPFGQRTGLSAGDIDGISRMYGFTPANTTITTIPEGLPLVVDGVPGASPQSFAWAAGSTHNISVSTESGTDPRYRLVRWSDGGDAAHDVTASTARTVFAAVFQRLHLVSVSGSGNGTASLFPPSPDGYYPERMPVRIAAIAGPGNKLAQWLGQPNLQNSGYGLASDVATVEVTAANTRYIATFTNQVGTTIDSDPRGRQVLVDGGLYLTPARFTWTSGSSHVVSLATLQPGSGAGSQYRFVSWDDGSTLASHTVVAGSSDAVFRATFTTQYRLSTATAGPGSVTVSPISGDGFYDAGTDVQLTALPNNGSTLEFWQGDLLGDDVVKTLRMDQPRSVQAGFGPAIAFFALNAGTYQFNPVFSSSTPSVAPGEILGIFSHSVIGPASPTPGQIQNGKVTTVLAGTRILFDGVAAPMLYGQQGFLQAIVPGNVSGKTSTTMRLERNGVLGAGITFSVQETFPGIFTADVSGKGPIVAINEDSSLNSPDNPAAPGSVVSFYVTGGGLLETPVADGQVMGSDLVHLKAPTYVRVGKLPADILYAGSIPTAVNGAVLVQIRLPQGVLGGPAIAIQLIFGNYASPPGTTIAVQ
jgi:astacin